MDIQGWHQTVLVESRGLELLKPNEDDPNSVECTYLLLAQSLAKYVLSWCNRTLNFVCFGLPVQKTCSSPFEVWSVEALFQICKKAGESVNAKFKKREQVNKTLEIRLDGHEVSFTWLDKILYVKQPVVAFASSKKGLFLYLVNKGSEDHLSGPWIKGHLELPLIHQLVFTKNLDQRKEILLTKGAPQEIGRFADKYLANADLLQGSGIDPEERRPPFPKWSVRRLEQINLLHLQGTEPCAESFRCRVAEIRGSNEECKECLEYRTLSSLWWYFENVFMNPHEQVTYICADESEIQGQKRLKALVVRGNRESGKTKFFESWCNFNPKRIIHIKGSFNKSQFTNLEHAWLILIDDFQFTLGKDLQTLKSIVAGESTVIRGPWLSRSYPGGIPSVILCNEDHLFYWLYQNSNFNDQCLFIDIDSHIFLGPPNFRRSQISIPLCKNVIPHEKFDLTVQKSQCESKKKSGKRSRSEMDLNEADIDALEPMIKYHVL